MTKPSKKSRGKKREKGIGKVRLSRESKIVKREEPKDTTADDVANFLEAGDVEQNIYLELQQLESDPEEEDRR